MNECVCGILDAVNTTYRYHTMYVPCVNYFHHAQVVVTLFYCIAFQSCNAPNRPRRRERYVSGGHTISVIPRGKRLFSAFSALLVRFERFLILTKPFHQSLTTRVRYQVLIILNAVCPEDV